ncbi:MAG: hypothetical protein MUF71_18780 [Candidatus Kapabacteria bacterium]|jgi:hypothetical protein|nr:hypothetical protein [Candidatus Kapabacteria bacterium]
MAHIDEMLDVEHYLKNAEFIAFLKQSALEAINQVSAEELAEFVFGGLDESIEAFDAELGSPVGTVRMGAKEDDDDEDFDEDEYEEDDFDEDDDEEYDDEDLEDLEEFDPEEDDEEDEDDDEEDDEQDEDDDIEFEEFDEEKFDDFDDDDDYL